MAKQSIKSIISNLLNKADTTANKYEEVAEKKHAELLQLNTAIQEKTVELRDVHKMVVLGEITESQYTQMKDEVESLKKKSDELKAEIKMIETYKTEDVEDVIQSIKQNQQEFNAEQVKEINKLKDEVQQARLEYLKKLSEAGKKYNAVTKNDSRIQNLLMVAGKQKRSHVSSAFESMGYLTYVDRNTVEQAFKG